MTIRHKLLIEKINALSEMIGKVTAWLVVILVLLISYDVAMRYLFQSGSVALQELEWYLFSLIFLLGAAYTMKHDNHVRVDLIYRSSRLSDNYRAWVNIFGGLIFLIPFCLLVIINSWPFVENSFLLSETSPDPGGLSHRWLLKAMIPFGFTLLLLQGVADILKNLNNIIHRKQS